LKFETVYQTLKGAAARCQVFLRLPIAVERLANFGFWGFWVEPKN